ncbi:hypothetical protein AMTRI_Chr11g95710 [Amborella trichopoda]|uniref:TLDc domain-containing protein n=1 Tax=Amborella trichopoda TaxID=13333 RepID=U5CSH4_AMBTC|nr:TLD domain-containing protein 1 [Amborella trichopoda]ERN16196.1 hypothetical protein AMTR_s00030p00240810 [Amborella trichopoda]|eukprot:XP_006854729.1 TLD domain-containing protein 1 [Amborella trichopoda]
MGNAQSPPSDPLFLSASRSFTQKELEDLNSLFRSLAEQSGSGGKFITLPVFQAYFSVLGPLGSRLFHLVTQKRNDQQLTFEDLIIAKGTYEKGSREEVEEFINQLVDVNGDGILDRSDLEVVLKSTLEAVFTPKAAEAVNNLDYSIIEVFLHAAKFSKEGSSMSYEDFKNWCNLIPSVRKFLGNLLLPLDPGSGGCHLPQLLCPEDFSPDLLVLRKEYAWHISGALSQKETEEWRLLYHSSVHGLSFNTFLGNLQNAEGPTIMLIKDKEGFIYGGYASLPWERHSDFYGDMKSFLFSLYPHAAIFRPTGSNGNLQWCAVNFTSESIPNGLGFGGRANHFGLFISASFDHGHTFTCSTFDNPCLSKQDKIYPEIIECWGVMEKGGEQEKFDSVKGTILERFKEDRNMLNMVGLANASE